MWLYIREALSSPLSSGSLAEYWLSLGVAGEELIYYFFCLKKGQCKQGG